MGEPLTLRGREVLRRPVTRVRRAMVVLVLLVGVTATGCASTEREILAVVDGAPLTVATTPDGTCVEFGRPGGARACWPAVQPEQLLVAASAIEGTMVVVAAAPDGASQIVVRGDGFARTLIVQQTDSGRYAVGPSIPTGTYEVTAEREDGSVVLVAEEVRLALDSTTSATVTP